MSCLHPYSDFIVHRSRSCLVLLLLLAWCAEGQNVDLEFPVFNETTFTCTGIPQVIGYAYCFFPTDGKSVQVLPYGYNNVYPNQATRFMYSTPVVFENSGATVQASFSAFFIFSVSHVRNHSRLGGGFAFMVAPEISTPDNSASGGFGMFPMDPKTGKATDKTPMVMGVEFDTSYTEGIDTVPVPHIGIDITSIGGTTGNNATHVSTTFLDAPVGFWVDYNSTLRTVSVYGIPVNATDASAASLKPATPIVTLGNLALHEHLNRRSYIGFGAGVFGGGFEKNQLFYWTFQTFGFPPDSLFAQWYQWWGPLSATTKVGLLVGAVIGTLGGVYACSEGLFFCFFKRIKNPQTPEQQRWPVQRRKSLPGTRSKKVAPRRKVRDSLSVANPLHLWEAPLEPAEDPDGEPEERPTSGIPDEDYSSTEDTPLMSPPGDVEEDDIAQDDQYQEQMPEVEAVEDQVPEVTPVEDIEAPPPQVESRQSSRGARSSTQKAAPSPPPPVAMRLSSPPPIERRPPQVGTKGPAPGMEKKGAPPPTPAQGVHPAKPSSPPQQRPPQKPSQGVQGAKPSSPPPHRPPQSQGAKPTSPPSQGAKPTSPQSQGAKPTSPQSQGAKPTSPQSQAAKPTSPQSGGAKPASPQSQRAKQGTPHPARQAVPPQRPSPAGTSAAPRRPSQVAFKKEPALKAPASSPQISPPKTAPRPPTQSPPKKSP